MPTYTITELAEEFAITPRAIRFYEDHGILNPKREDVGGRHRVYPARERTRLKLTLRNRPPRPAWPDAPLGRIPS